MPLEPATREEIAILARRTGLQLNEEHFNQLVDAYGHLEQMLGASGVAAPMRTSRRTSSCRPNSHRWSKRP